MKKFILLTLMLVALCSKDGYTQQLWRRTQFAINPFLVNPAIAGTENQIPLYLSYRNQWTGFKGAPVTMLASGHMQGPRNSGFGAVIQRDDTGGAITRTGVEAVGAYHIDLNNYDGISFGLGLSANQFKIDCYGPNRCCTQWHATRISSQHRCKFRHGHFWPRLLLRFQHSQFTSKQAENFRCKSR